MALSAETVAIHKYIMRKGNRIGYYSGYTLANRMGLSTQVPFTEEITSNLAPAKVREITIKNRKYIVRRSPVEITDENAKVVLEKQGEGSFNKRYMTPVSVECEAIVENENYEWIRRKNSLKASRSTVEPRAICKKAYKMANKGEHILPVLSYQSTARMWMQKREAVEDVFSKKFYRTVGYEGCLQEASNIKMLMNWVRHMEKMEWKRKETIGEYYGVKKAVCKFMQCMMDEEVLSFEYDDQSDELIFLTKANTLPVRYLSAGYQSLIWMIFDIAFRMALLNPNLLENISETPGVVLIDELDMHLHPKWQWKVMEALIKTFPNVQFIAATHSPIIIASCKGINVITIDEYKDIRYDNSC